MCVESSSDDERQSSTEDSRMVENFDDFDVREIDNFDVKEIKVEDEVRKQDHGKHMLEACSGEKLDEKSDHLNSHPVFESPLKGFSAERLLNIIVGKDVPKNKLCKSIPRAVRKHATFVVDTTFMDSSDIIGYGDDNGSWKGHTKPRRKYAIEVCDVTDTLLVEEYKGESEDVQDLPSNVYTLCRNYFRHAHTLEFRKMIATVRDHNGKILPFVVIQYYFEGGIEVPIKLAKHGNAKKDNSLPYMRTSRPVLQKLKKKCSQLGSCRKAVEECFEDGGGTSGMSSLAEVPRNRKQAYNMKQQVSCKKQSVKTAQRHEFYDILELLNEGTFVRAFSFAKSSSASTNSTQPRSFQATSFQLQQLSRICASEKYGSVLGVDATFNCGNFFVTLTSFKHKMFVHKDSGTNPVVVGPSIIHTTKEFEDYHYLASQLKTHCANFESLTAFGTDGEINIANAFVCELPGSIHLRCKIHLHDNIDRKLSSLSYDKVARQEVLNSIFGKRVGNTRTKALTDASTAEEFDTMLNDLETKWLQIETSQHSGDVQFFSWFKNHLVVVMKENVIASVRQNAGLGCPPEFYTQNSSECSNSIVKRNAGGKREWSDFCTSLEDTAKSQALELEKAVYGMGEFRLSHDFKHLAIRADKWVEMSAEQQDAHIKRCFGNPLDKIGKSEEDLQSQVAANNQCNLSIGFNECSITTLSQANLRYMWSAASKILDETDGVLRVPWDKKGTQRLVFNGNDIPPCQVNVEEGESIKCSCAKFKSAMICPHSLAVAESEHCLPNFLARVRSKRKEPDPYKLVSSDLPRSAAKKSSTSKRKGKANDKRVPLMQIQSSSTVTRPPNATVESIAASALLALSDPNLSQENDENFSLKFLAGTQVRTCYGCGQCIRVPPAVPAPPHDLCLVNKEFRSYRAQDGSLKVSNAPQNCHYHLRRSCVERKHADFQPSNLKIPAGAGPYMTAVHWNFLSKEFGLKE